jgi:hypothetical protein
MNFDQVENFCMGNGVSPCVFVRFRASPCVPGATPVRLHASRCVPVRPSASRASGCVPVRPGASPCVLVRPGASPCVQFPLIYLIGGKRGFLHVLKPRHSVNYARLKKIWTRTKLAQIFQSNPNLTNRHSKFAMTTQSDVRASLACLPTWS